VGHVQTPDAHVPVDPTPHGVPSGLFAVVWQTSAPFEQMFSPVAHSVEHAPPGVQAGAASAVIVSAWASALASSPVVASAPPSVVDASGPDWKSPTSVVHPDTAPSAKRTAPPTAPPRRIIRLY
jgi:hypothetical protein